MITSIRKCMFTSFKDHCVFQYSPLCHFKRHFSNKDSEKTDHYKSLGLPSSASHTDIKNAYYNLTFKYHPDRNEGDEAASKNLKAVMDAYEVLGNYGLRKRYDKGLPLPPSKQKLNAVLEEPEVKYQKFFDSRSIRSNYYKPQFQPLEDPKEEHKRNHPPILTKNERAVEKSQQILVVILFIIAVCIAKLLKQ